MTSAAPTTAHRCPKCARRFVVVRDGDLGPALCACGAILERVDLSAGVYEIRRSRRASRRRLRAPSPAKKGDAATPLEPDQGYGESHGYGPAHGGPTGPGDAPAPPAGEPAEPSS